MSKTQSVIAHVSVESELYAISTGFCRRTLHTFLLNGRRGFSNNVTLEIKTDSSSAGSMAKQCGTALKTRRIQLRYLCMQDLVQSGILKIIMISGDTNPFRCLTNSTSRHAEETSSTHWNCCFDSMSDIPVFFNLPRIQQ